MDGEYILVQKGAKVVIFQVDVFGLTTYFWGFGDFEGSQFIFKDLAVNRWFRSGDEETL